MNVPLGGRELIAANVYACRDAIPNTGTVTDHLSVNANLDGVGCIATNVSNFYVLNDKMSLFSTVFKSLADCSKTCVHGDCNRPGECKYVW